MPKRSGRRRDRRGLLAVRCAAGESGRGACSGASRRAKSIAYGACERLGAVWRTGDPAYHPKMKQALGFNGNEQVVGLIYVGYPDMNPPAGKRVPAAEKTVWLEG
ncbi:nitroreductase family protein [Cohnella cholangitidis]|uniref:hypothetical protein n=1 Tax=Cohnella cholangitidis TaxID=2598458 RepID=UPI002D2183A1|nr:hypothetical protein [Cohnella cholangitidis]